MSRNAGIVSLGLVLALLVASAPIVWQVMQSAESAAQETPPVADAPLAALEAELSILRREVQVLQARVDGLDARTSIGLAGNIRTPAPLPTALPDIPQPDLPQGDTLSDNFAQVVLIADRLSANEGLSLATPTFLRETFGLPRQDLDQECRSLTNPKLRGLISTESVGPIRARLLAPALASLRRVFAEVQEFEPELYARLASSGSLCVRLIRGARSAASAHAYGLAVDLNIDGQLDNFADGRTQLGLILMADFFKKEGWIWGAGFRREDSMHFEVSRNKIEEWQRQGLL